MNSIIRFSNPTCHGNEKIFIEDAIINGHLSGDGPYTRKCSTWLENYLGVPKVLLTHSCTAALEMAALLIDIQPGDEVIMPSYTFVSTANAFVLRGAVPVFVDICSNTLCIDHNQVESAITARTKAIVAVHYSGVSCDMSVLMDIAQAHHLYVIEDAAQALMSTYKGRPLGSIGHLSTFSFHETKNIVSGEGGALVINDNAVQLIERAEIIREKGTNRSQFYRGQKDKYTWVDIGSSYLPNELTTAFLYAQLQKSHEITHTRLRAWDRYSEFFALYSHLFGYTVQQIPYYSGHNAHMFYLIMNNSSDRDICLKEFRRHGINAVFHYIPLHSSSFGKMSSRYSATLQNTDLIASRIIRFPLWCGIFEYQDFILNTALNIFKRSVS